MFDVTRLGTEQKYSVTALQDQIVSLLVPP